MRGEERGEPDAAEAWEHRLGHRFAQPGLLRQALTHRSLGRKGPDPAVSAPGDNERFEFLGDAVLGLRVCERLFQVFPQCSEGQLSRLRSWLVSARNLALAAHRLDLGPQLRLSSAEAAIGGRDKQRLLANAMEAVIAAVYLDAGYAAAAEFIDTHILGSSLESLSPEHLHEFAYKSALQEWAHANGRTVPSYRVMGSSGPDHEKTFTVEVAIPEVFVGTATGASKKEAEQRAAAQALAFLGLV